MYLLSHISYEESLKKSEQNCKFDDELIKNLEDIDKRKEARIQEPWRYPNIHNHAGKSQATETQKI